MAPLHGVYECSIHSGATKNEYINMTILIGFIAVWAALCFLIGLLSFFIDNEREIMEKVKNAIAVGYMCFIMPVFVPYLKHEKRRAEKLGVLGDMKCC